MAINAYTGLMGSGKSYEVVSSVIVPAVMAGRRVVTNIDGINPAKIHEYCEARRKSPEQVWGEIVSVTKEDVCKDGFFPDEDLPDQPSIVQPGDLVAIDEAWNFWATSHKISSEHMKFFRMHRHYTHPTTGVACDVALMIQSIGDLHRVLKAVVELTFRTVKIKQLGLHTTYRVEMYEGHKVTKASRLEVFVKRYDKEVFPLYKSYAGTGGKEKSIDKRQNVLSNPRLWFLIGGIVVMACVSSFFVYRFFKGDSFKTSAKTSAPASSSAPGAASAAPVRHVTDSSSTWRVAGTLFINGVLWVVVVDQDGRTRLESGTGFVGQGQQLTGRVDGEKVSTWSGSVPTSVARPSAPAVPTGGLGK